MAETSGLLNRRTGDSRTEGSNPSVSATKPFATIRNRPKNRVNLETNARNSGRARALTFAYNHAITG